MRQTSGFALIVAIIMLVVLASLGFAAMFLTDMNLKIAENGRTQTLARFNAEGGLDSAFVVLAGEVQEQLRDGADLDAVLPENLAEFRETFPAFENDEYALVDGDGYTFYGDGTARIRVIGFGPRDAEYVAEALVRPLANASDAPGDYSLFGEGFVARGDIDMAGKGTYDINFMSGGNISLRAATLLEGNIASAAGSTCSFKWGEGQCLTDQEPPDVPDPDFAALRASVIEDLEEDASWSLPSGQTWSEGSCDTSPATINSTSNAIICVPSNTSVTISGNVEGLTVIGDETTTVNIDASTGDVDDDSVNGVTVVSGTVNFGGGASFAGSNSIIAQNDIEFGQNVVSNDETARTFIVTEGDFTLNGAGTSDIYASFWVGGTFTVNGTGDKFRSTVVSSNTIFKAGAGSFATLSAPSGLDLEYAPDTSDPEYTTSGIRVISRR